MQLLKLRYFQLKRDLGIWVLILAALAFLISNAVAENSKQYLLLFCLAIVYNYHMQRRDLNFILKYFRAPRRQVAVNYNLLVLPVTAGMLLNAHYICSLALHGLVTLISLMNYKIRGPRLKFISRYIPPGHFEWISGLRKNFFISFLIIPILILSPVKLFGLAGLFLLNVIFISFYGSCEPLSMLNPGNLTARDFLRQKTKFFTRIIIITNVPVLAINSFFNQDAAWFNAGFLAGFLLLSACSIYIKYSNYKPNQNLPFHIDYLILSGALLIPYLLPLAIIVYFNNRKKAIQNLIHIYDYS
jgi:hypothetical protein